MEVTEEELGVPVSPRAAGESQGNEMGWEETLRHAAEAGLGVLGRPA